MIFLENGMGGAGFDLLEDNEGNIIYTVQSFDNTTEVVIYNLDSQKSSVKKINNTFRDIRYYNKTFYSVIPHFIHGDLQRDLTPRKELSHLEVFDIFNDVKVKVIDNGNLIYFDEYMLVTSKYIKEKLKYEITLLNLLNENVNTFISKHSRYFYKHDLLLFY